MDVIIYSDEQEEINSWSQCLSEDGIDGETFPLSGNSGKCNNGSVRRLENKAYNRQNRLHQQIIMAFITDKFTEYKV